MNFRPLSIAERAALQNALRENAEQDRAILMDKHDTTFAGTTAEVTDEEVISAVRSVPCHY
jgi:ABC-type cobalamin transport system ATPase subunit